MSLVFFFSMSRCFGTLVEAVSILHKASLINGNQLRVSRNSEADEFGTTPFLLGSKFLQVERRNVPRLTIIRDRPATCSLSINNTVVFASNHHFNQYGHFLFNTFSNLWEIATTAVPRTNNSFLLMFIHPQCGTHEDFWEACSWEHPFTLGEEQFDVKRLTRRLSKVENLPHFMHDLLETLTPAENILSLNDLLCWSRENPDEEICFDVLVPGLSGTTVDHYNSAVPRETWRQFHEHVLHAFGDTAHGPVRRSLPRSSTLHVIIVSRSINRRLVTAGELRTKLEATGKYASVVVVDCGRMSVREQVRTFSRADIVVGMDGTDLFNANWMQPHSALVRIFPYKARDVFSNKGDNFKSIWQALDIHVVDITIDNPCFSRAQPLPKQFSSLKPIFNVSSVGCQGTCFANSGAILNEILLTGARLTALLGQIQQFARTDKMALWGWVLSQDTCLPFHTLLQALDKISLYKALHL